MITCGDQMILPISKAIQFLIRTMSFVALYYVLEATIMQFPQGVCAT